MRFDSPWAMVKAAWSALDRAVFPPQPPVPARPRPKEGRQMATVASPGDTVPLHIDLGDVPAVQAALRNRRDHHRRQINNSVHESRVQQHHRDWYEALDRVCRDLQRSADAVNGM